MFDLFKLEKIGIQTKKMEEEKGILRSRMWKQVITENEREEKEEKKDRTEELIKMLKDFNTAFEERKEKENMERSMETDRTIHFMGILGIIKAF